jgi:NAD(P)H-flavin reductase
VKTRRFPPGHFLMVQLPGDRVHKEFILVDLSPWLSSRTQ